MFNKTNPCNLLLVFCTLLSILFYSTKLSAQIKTSSAQQVSLGRNNSVPSGASGSPAIAANGQKLVFNSDADNLVESDNNSARDIFLSDLKTGSTSRVNINNSGSEADGSSFNPAISAIAPDGFFAVAYESEARNLSAFADSAGKKDIFLSFPGLNFTEIVSIASGPVFANADSRNASVSIQNAPRKVLIAFESDASNLVPGDNNSKTDIFIATISLPSILNTENFASSIKLTRISSGTNTESNGNSEKPAISADGRYVVFTSSASNLISGVTSSSKQIYLYDISKNTLSLISKDSSGIPGNADSFAASINFNGRYVVYLSKASSLDSDASESKTAVLLFDRQTAVTSRINTDIAGIKGNGSANSASISANGRFVSFSDTSSNLISDDTNGIADVFVKDLLNSQLSRVSIGSAGQEPNAASDLTTLSGNNYSGLNAQIIFRSFATNFDTAGTASGSDIFINQAFLPNRTLIKKTSLDVPADVSQTGKKASFIFEDFLSTASSSISTRSKPIKIKYDLRITKLGRNKELINKISKKNQLTVSRLKPGNYSSKYRAVGVRGDRIVTASKFSPVQKFTVVK